MTDNHDQAERQPAASTYHHDLEHIANQLDPLRHIIAAGLAELIDDPNTESDHRSGPTKSLCG